MHALEVLVELNARACDVCAHCGEYRQALDAHNAYLAPYEVFNAEAEKVALLCPDCVAELVECGHSVKRVKP